MAVHTLGAVNLLDTTKYRTVAAQSTIRTIRERIIVKRRGADGSRLARSEVAQIEIDVMVWAIGTTFNSALTNWNAIISELALARAYALAGSGSQIQYSEQWGNESAARTYNVFDGDFDMEQREMTSRNLIGGRLHLLCNP